MEAKSYKEYLKHITTFIFDVDGVLTDGMLSITSDGELLRNMNVKDGYAMKTALNAGFNICIISGGNNPGVEVRLGGLGIKDIFLGADNKIDQFEEFTSKKNIKPENVLYMGDDIPDIPVMKKVGLATCPQDAVSEVKGVSHYVSHKHGGKGAVRDVIEQVMKVQDEWDGNFGAKHD